MRNIYYIAAKELKHLFISPIAYVIAFILFVIMGILFYISILQAALQQFTPNIQVVLGPLSTILLFTVPAITMRSLAEEQKGGTLELLLTSPVRDWEVIIGKWLGSVVFILLILLITWVYPIIMNQIVQPGIDQGLMAAGYLGLFLMVSSFLAIGVAMSSLFSNQIAAFFATFGVLLVLWLIGYPAQIMGALGGAGILQYLDIQDHFFNSFYTGVIELKDVIYYLSVISLALFLGSVSIETRRWR